MMCRVAGVRLQTENFDYSDEQLDNLLEVSMRWQSLIIEDFKTSVQDIMHISQQPKRWLVERYAQNRFQSAKDKYLALRDELLMFI